ncbi:Uncharacterised protein (plasmid) [Klebsiella aerogenes]|nr:Uncharacterised protein [Klebsiella aerogenes]
MPGVTGPRQIDQRHRLTFIDGDGGDKAVIAELDMLNIRLLHLVKQVLYRFAILLQLALLLARFWFSSSSPAGSRSTTSASGTLRLAVTSSLTSTSSPLRSEVSDFC